MANKFDNNVILCKWKRRPQGYRLWVKGQPSISGEGDTLETAEEALTDAVWLAAEDLDTVEAPIFVYEPPLPVSAATERYLKPELHLVRGDERFVIGPEGDGEGISREAYRDWLRAHVDGLYDGGFCRTCGRGIGKRTQQPVQISSYGAASDGGYISLPGFDTGTFGHVYSDRFLALLTSEERNRLSFLRVHLTKKSGRREYYELVSPADASFVGVKGLDGEGRECPACGQASITFDEEPTVDLFWFICRSDLPDPLPSCFVVGYNNKPYVCFTRERWDQTRGRPGTKGMVPALVGVVSEEECDRDPRLAAHSRDCECHSQWPDPVTVAGKERKCWDLPIIPAASNAPSDRNLQWIKPAEEAGTIQIMRQTLTLDEMESLIWSGRKPKQLEFISFRCPKCWRLGWIIAKPRELSFVWW